MSNLLVLLSLWISVWESSSARAGVPPATQTIIVKMRDCDKEERIGGKRISEKLAVLSRRVGERLSFFRCMSGGEDVLKLSRPLPQGEVEAIAARIKTDPDVQYAEADRIALADLVPTDPSYSNQWSLKTESGSIGMPSAWDVTTGSVTLIMAVLDTGITAHPDLSGRYVGGYNFISDATMAGNGVGRSSDPSDLGDFTSQCPAQPSRCSSWHGSHVAGIMAAAANNGQGITGINWASRVLPVRVLGRGGGTSSDIIDGIRWAAGLAVTGVPANPHPVKVMNLSLGAEGACTPSYQSAIDEVKALGVTVVVSAGNDAANLATNPKTPAVCDGVITVAAVTRAGARAAYSNFGTSVEIAAPGGEAADNTDVDGILSTVNAGLTTLSTSYTFSYYQGTSMAAPHVAGVISLLLSIANDLTPAQALSAIQSSATTFAGGSGCTTATCGSGILSATSAMGAVRSRVSVISEGLRFVLRRAGSTLSKITVHFTLGGSSTSGIEAGKLAGSVVFAAGSSQAIVSLEPLGAELVTGQVTLALTASSSYESEAPATALISFTGQGEKVSPEVLRAAAGEQALSECGLKAAFQGSRLSAELPMLRRFRDEYLRSNRVGRQVLRAYYVSSRWVSPWLRRSEALRGLARWSAAPIILVVKELT